jgi:hypothetical protein
MRQRCQIFFIAVGFINIGVSSLMMTVEPQYVGAK